MGYTGTGTFTQSGGTNTCPSGGVAVGYLTGSSGTYSLSGGLLNTDSVNVGELYGNANCSGIGEFVQSGGTNTLSTELNVGNNTGGTCKFNLSGGLVSTPIEYVGGYNTGMFTQTGGTKTSRLFSDSAFMTAGVAHTASAAVAC